MPTPLSSEARQFLTKVRREALRREQIMALVLSGGRTVKFVEALSGISSLIMSKTLGPLQMIQLLMAKAKALQAIRDDDRAFAFLEVNGTRRTAHLNLLGVGFDRHPLAVVETETSLIAVVSQIEITRSRHRVQTYPVAVISSHTIGRVYERATGDFTPGNIFGMATKIGLATTMLTAATGDRHAEHELCIRVASDTFLVGVIRLGVGRHKSEGQERNGATLFFDARSCLDGDMLDANQLRQALAFERFTLAATNSGDLSLADGVPVVAAPIDYVRRQQQKRDEQEPTGS